ncbi:MAG: YlmC/YmxH family sporulation protein [Oscillospiraceae bacterium]
MLCKLADLRSKYVINVKTGCNLGTVDDMQIDTENNKVVAVVIYGRLRCFGLLGRWEDILIPWESIDFIGEDSILVSMCSRTSRSGEGAAGCTWKSKRQTLSKCRAHCRILKQGASCVDAPCFVVLPPSLFHSCTPACVKFGQTIAYPWQSRYNGFKQRPTSES